MLIIELKKADLCLSDFVIVVRELKIDSTSVNVH